MTVLPKDLRNQLARTVLQARETAEAAARKALHVLGVDEPDAPAHLTPDQRVFRRALRAQARQLGDVEDLLRKGHYRIDHLVEKIAYDQWHRMLFARFLAENDLLISPDHGVSVSIDDCRELAPEMGMRDGWEVAACFAAGMLPQIFRADDPAGRIELAPEDRGALQGLALGLPRDIFLADDSLGWVYQFWQAKRKDEVNRSEKKIGADEIAPVTQLFTEDYMVLFLLHNTLGAWWAGKRMPEEGVVAESEEDARTAVAISPVNLHGEICRGTQQRALGEMEEDQGTLPRAPTITWEYLRFVKDEGAGTWRPAAGTFDGWPRAAKEIRVLDPCMGSGHFLVFALPILLAMRREEEGLSEAEACEAVLRDNLFGLEIDPRCTQIAAFNLAFAAWRLAGYRQLPPLNLACCGLGINAKKEDWLKLAGADERLQTGMDQLYGLFEQAPILGSLIDPGRIAKSLLSADFHELRPLLETALAAEESHADERLAEMGVTARGLTHVAEILAGSYSLVVTNVPYLGRGKQDEALKDYCESVHTAAKADLATCFVERCLDFCGVGGCMAVLTPQNWLFLGTYRKLRERLLKEREWNLVARLGEKGFDSPQAAGAFTALVGLTRRHPSASHCFAGIDVAAEETVPEKDAALLTHALTQVSQARQSENPDARIAFVFDSKAVLLSRCAVASQGIPTSDGQLFVRKFWELPEMGGGWEFHQGTVLKSTLYGGREDIILFEEGKGRLRRMSAQQERDRRRDFQGANAWSRAGVAVSLMRELFCTLYTGEKFDNNVSAVVPGRSRLVPALWAYCTSTEFPRRVREIDQKLNVTNATLVKVPFDLEYWQRVAAEKYPNALPKPHSNDPTQWLFNGHPCGAEQPLQVALARLLGYRWPRQTGSSFMDCPALEPDGLEPLVDQDGIVCISSIKGEQPAAERLRALLAAAFGDEWSAQKQAGLLEQADYGGKSLDDWLRNGFFEQHCRIFHQRPFIWHLWDGRKDGFSVLVNYHKLDRANLEKLTYTYLGDWISRQRASVDAGEEGSDARLAAALELKAQLEKIVEGEAPYDIFVRWKPIEQQPIGWNPDLNDGVRLNIRPFVTTGVLRKNPKINWNKDRGKDVPSAPWYPVFHGDRINDHHLPLAEKRAARAAAGRNT